MKGLPTVAAVVTNYNYARFLPDAIDSLLRQTVPFDEIIVVDDGSTDESSEVLRRYRDRIRILNITNRGPCGACFAAVSETTSDYIYTLDADDYAAPGLLAEVKPLLSTWPAKLQFQLLGVNQDGEALGSRFPTFPSGYDAAAMRADNAVIGFYICSITSGNVFSRDALSRLLASFNPRGGIDASPALAMPYLGEIISLSRPLAYYRVHDNSMSDWANPTTARLRRELQNFRMMWAEVASALGMNAIPFVESRREPVFVSERAVMIACDEGHVFPAPQVWRYVRGLASSHITKRHKFAFSAWALLLLLPSKKLRKYFVRVKRSPVNRPRGLQAVLGILSRRAARNISVYP